MRKILSLGRIIAAALVSVSACNASAPQAARPRLVVTTNILGQVVMELVGDIADVEVVMPVGADPHEFAPSVRQAEAIETADLLVINGAGFEEGMDDLIAEAAADGLAVFDAATHVPLVEDDPHVWMDPQRMATIVETLGQRLAGIDGVEAETIADNVADYTRRLTELDAEIAAMVENVPVDDRVLVTNHEVMGYFATRYGFEVLGAVIPSSSTGAQPSAGVLEELATTIDAAGVPTIFAETTRPAELAQALAAEVGSEVEVIDLFTESLGGPGSGAETYLDMMRTDAELIVAGLT